MKLNQLKDNPGARQSRILVGRGIGSGKGKTGGRGVKGQKARTGVSIKGFEGGQSPLIRRMPKSGFNNYHHATCYAVVTLDIISDALSSKKLKGEKIDGAALKAAGVIGCIGDGVKLVGSGEFKSKATIVVAKASAGAVKAVEKAGGKVEVLPAKVNKLLKKKAAK